MLLGATGMMLHSETKDLELQKFQLATEQSTQLRQGIVGNIMLIYVVVIKLSLLVYVYLLLHRSIYRNDDSRRELFQV